jgi:hypothetical protein
VGDQKGGPFEVEPEIARTMRAAVNPDGRSNADVIRPWVNGLDIGGRPRGLQIICFPAGMSMLEAALYEAPFEYVRAAVRPRRESASADPHSAATWWLHQRSRPEFRHALGDRLRYIATIRHSKHRLFVWLSANVIPDSALIVFARDDDYTFGVASSTCTSSLWRDTSNPAYNIAGPPGAQPDPRTLPMLRFGTDGRQSPSACLCGAY